MPFFPFFVVGCINRLYRRELEDEDRGGIGSYCICVRVLSCRLVLPIIFVFPEEIPLNYVTGKGMYK